MNYTGYKTGIIELSGYTESASTESQSKTVNVSVSVPDYNEQPFTMTFDATTATTDTRIGIDLGNYHSDDGSYHYWVRGYIYTYDRNNGYTKSSLPIRNYPMPENEWVGDFNGDDNDYAWFDVPSGCTCSVQIVGHYEGNTDLPFTHDEHILSAGTNTLNYRVSGNINSLFQVNEELIGNTSAMTKSFSYNPRNPEKTFSNLFFDDQYLVDAWNLVLPYDIVYNSQYESMFCACVNLERGPKELPSKTIGDYGYANMFEQCSSMTKGPSVLSAETLTHHCYRRMFADCSSLLNAPEITTSSFTLNASGICESMFYNCTALTKAPSNLMVGFSNEGGSITNSTSRHFFDNMFCNCSSLTKSPQLDVSTFIYNSAYVPGGNTPEEQHPGEYPIPSSMFSGCTSLKEIEMGVFNPSGHNFGDSLGFMGLAGDGPAVLAANRYFKDVASSGTFISDSDNVCTLHRIDPISGWTFERYHADGTITPCNSSNAENSPEISDDEPNGDTPFNPNEPVSGDEVDPNQSVTDTPDPIEEITGGNNSEGPSGNEEAGGEVIEDDQQQAP